MTTSNKTTDTTITGRCYPGQLLRWLQTVDPCSEKTITAAMKESSLTYKFAQQFLKQRFEVELAVPSEISSSMPLSLPNALPNIQSLASGYEETLHSGAVKKQGAVYTPLALVDQVLNEAVAVRPLDTIKTILDPACGSGIFVINAIKRMPVTSLSNASEIIRAIDINSAALSVARLLSAGTLYERDLSKSLFAHWLSLEKSFVHGNFLVSESDQQLNSGNSLESLIPLPSHFSIKTPALIIGNPPYGLSRNEQLSKNENELLLKKYSWARSGKVNKYLLFMAESYSRMAPGDVLSFVVPNAWLGIRSARCLREILLESKSLASISSFKERAFGKASVEAVTFLVQKESIKNDIAVRIFETTADSIPSYKASIPANTCLTLLESRIPLCWIPDGATILDTITRNSIRLHDSSSPFKPAIALQAYARGKGSPPQTKEIVSQHVFHHDTAVNDTCIPYLEGRDVGRYQINWSGRFLSYGPWLAEPQSLTRFTGPRIVVREVTGTHPTLLHAAFTDESFLYNKSCLHILPTNHCESPAELFALLGILNSPLTSFIIKLTGNKSQRLLFPKIVNADLLSLPLPISFQSNYKELADLVVERMQQSDLNEQLEEKITTAVFDLYELPERHRRRIRDNHFPY